ncbi:MULTISPECIES: hypothetical protein [Burkholderia]|uniref:hypothetical protein n=1 Tax=Burkholderia TaxID=32008 RepID=UPI000556A6D3|nr:MULTISPECIES: hypothetical protein [Burkholderia]TCT28565.1 hypothetical protein EC918_10831 [Burkholderia vietnamiensis]SCZ33043.1 hypothetical protein SAMN02787148_11031 [Burkholderia vietnamiensis]SFX92820.1 hypothetical protein SAMN02787160_11032 [Burkholderia vietnamiensis]
MKERPILFSGPMVRAILEGRKTQTRRVAKEFAGRDDLDAILGRFPNQRGCPHGEPGDRLWVREAFRLTSDFDGDNPTRVGERCLDAGYRAPWAPVRYEVDGAERDWRWVGTPPGHEVTAGRARASMHMPRWASRITLEITRVRAERLQTISWDDAIAEGIKDPRRAAVRIDPIDGTVAQFRQLWDSLNASRGHGWDANPWVWVVEFRKVES